MQSARHSNIGAAHMVRSQLWPLMVGLALTLAVGVSARAADDGQELLNKATEAKLGAQNVTDLNQVVRLCQEAIAAGLDAENKKFANDLLAGTLTQRAELVCRQLFE